MCMIALYGVSGRKVELVVFGIFRTSSMDGVGDERL